MRQVTHISVSLVGNALAVLLIAILLLPGSLMSCASMAHTDHSCCQSGAEVTAPACCSTVAPATTPSHDRQQVLRETGMAIQLWSHGDLVLSSGLLNQGNHLPPIISLTTVLRT